MRLLISVGCTIKDIKNAHICKNHLLYETKGLNLMQQPKVGDVVLVLAPSGLGSTSKLGRVTHLGETTVSVKFPKDTVTHTV